LTGEPKTNEPAAVKRSDYFPINDFLMVLIAGKSICAVLLAYGVGRTPLLPALTKSRSSNCFLKRASEPLIAGCCTVRQAAAFERLCSLYTTIKNKSRLRFAPMNLRSSIFIIKTVNPVAADHERYLSKRSRSPYHDMLLISETLGLISLPKPSESEIHKRSCLT
jgi:hypothetical protein